MKDDSEPPDLEGPTCLATDEEIRTSMLLERRLIRQGYRCLGEVERGKPTPEIAGYTLFWRGPCIKNAKDFSDNTFHQRYIVSPTREKLYGFPLVNPQSPLS